MFQNGSTTINVEINLGLLVTTIIYLFYRIGADVYSVITRSERQYNDGISYVQKT